MHDIAPEIRVASSLSPVELFVVLYYGKFIKINPKNPSDKNRTKCIISKGHGSLCMYPILADLGFFKKEELKLICSGRNFLGGIPDPIIPGYETINGSLGHGLGVASGIALANKLKNNKRNTYIVSGDGELMEGSVWEAVMFAGHHELKNLIMLVDNNSISMLDKTKNIIDPLNLQQKFIEFGWYAITIKDGHNVEEIFRQLKKINLIKSKKPKVLILNTLKGNRVPGLENFHLSHVTAVKKELLKDLIDNE